MHKKEYMKPSVKAINLDTTVSILAGSDPVSFDLYDEEVASGYEVIQY